MRTALSAFALVGLGMCLSAAAATSTLTAISGMLP